MDHWGDPWADNAEQQKSPTKDPVLSPLPPTLAPAPVLLNGFLDDAGWGNEDESFGDWSTSAGIDAIAKPSLGTRIPSPSPRKIDRGHEDTPRWDVDDRVDKTVLADEETWEAPISASPDAEKGAANTTEISTAIRADADAENVTKDTSTQPQSDDDSSAQPFTSQSDLSRHKAPIESNRTSFEDGHMDGKQTIKEARPEEESGHVEKTEVEEEDDDDSSLSSNSTEDGYGTSTADTLLTEGPQGQNETAEEPAKDSKEDVPKSAAARTETTPSSPTTVTRVNAYQVDTSLLDELFPSQKNEADLEDAPDDPIYSTSARKAWYRLTRKQTMREFNSGTSDDSYIRVTWSGSQIRTDVHKTVARWAREDRMSGTGPGAGASFYWDTPAPIEPKIPKGHQRTKTSIPTQRIAAPMRQSLPPAATNTAAAFNWDSPTSTINPWNQDPGLHSTVSPATSKPPTLDNEQTQELRAVSVDLMRGAGETQRPTSVVSSETPTVANTIPPPPPTTTSANSGRNSSAPDTNTLVLEQRADVPDDDNDDWGEMISSPTVPTPVSAFPFPASIPAPTDNSVSNFSPTPETSANQDSATDAMHAASIVRLKSTISPTSAIFGNKSFVPFGVEQGPIGPGILKPVKRPVASTPEKPKNEVLPESLRKTPPREKGVSQVRHVEDDSGLDVKQPETSTKVAVDDFSVFESNARASEPTQPSTPPRAPPVEPITDSWADADFSIFESAPTAVSDSSKSRPKHDSADPFSVFQTPPRPTSAASSAKTFTRSSPSRVVTPPAIQPLTGATNSAQRRKMEEEQTIREILAGLPDLSYMLR